MRTSNGIHVAIAKNSTVCLSVTNGCADHHHMGNMQTYPFRHPTTSDLYFAESVCATVISRKSRAPADVYPPNLLP